MEKRLMGKRIVVLVANGFDETDFSLTQRLLATEGAQAKIVSTENGLVNSWRTEEGQTMGKWGHHFPVDASVSTVLAADYDGLLIVGGSRSIDKLKDNAHAKRIMRGFMDAGKPAMLLGEAVQMLAVAERAKGYTVTGSETLEKTLVDAGATWVNEAVVEDGHLVTALKAETGTDFADLCAALFLQTPAAYELPQAA
jgi:protease I